MKYKKEIEIINNKKCRSKNVENENSTDIKDNWIC